MIKVFNKIKVPAIGLGTWRLKGTECIKAVHHALDIGYRHIDTAQAYGNEEDIGKALAESDIRREEIFITTKLHWDELRDEQILKGFKQSLQKLMTDYTDLLLIHWPSTNVPLEESLEAMKVLKADGKTRAIGVSNFPPAMLQEALGIANIMCNQIEYHPYLNQEKLLNIAGENDLMITAYSPLAKGGVMKDPLIERIGRKYNKNAAQVTLRWLIQQNNVVAIPKAADPEHRKANFNIFNFELTTDEMNEISSLKNGKRLINPVHSPEWND